jgi:hypothetical protein
MGKHFRQISKVGTVDVQEELFPARVGLILKVVAEPCSRLTEQASTPFCTASRAERTAKIHMPV